MYIPFRATFHFPFPQACFSEAKTEAQGNEVAQNDTVNGRTQFLVPHVVYCYLSTLPQLYHRNSAK